MDPARLFSPLSSAASSSTEVVRARLAAGVDSIDSVIQYLRHYVFGLRPGLLTGFEPAATADCGQGLRNLAERAACLGGRLEIESGSTGTTLTVRLSLEV